MSAQLTLVLVGLGVVGAFVAGLVGVGGAIVMIPLLLYTPPLLGVGGLDVKAVTGVTMTQVLVAAVSGMVAHQRYHAVNAHVAVVGGVATAVASFAGALVSGLVADRWLLLVFALMGTGAIVLLFVRPHQPGIGPAPPRSYSTVRLAGVGGGVGLCAGLVGAGGAFLLVPLLIVVVGVPLRVTIGSSLAVTALAAVAGFLGKALTGQIPWLPAITVAMGAVPGAQLGATLSRRLPPLHLRLALLVVVALSTGRVWWDLLVR